jgi:hypothetical protein
MILGAFESDDTSLVAASSDETVVVGSREQTGGQSASLVATWEVAKPVDTGSISGRVTAILVRPEMALENGTPVLEIDGVVRLAHVSDRPFFRQLQRGMAGRDVDALDQFLVEAGLAQSGTLDERGRFSRLTSQAVRNWQTITGAVATGVFEPSLVIFVPTTSTRIGELEIAVGQSVSEGDALYLPEPVLTGATLELLGTAAQQAVIEEGSELVVVAEDFEVVGAFGESFADPLGDLLSPPTNEATATREVSVRLKDPVLIGAIADTSIVTTTDGTQCVWVLAEDSFVATPVADVQPFEPGVAAVDQSLIGQTILASPTGERANAC